MAYFVVTDESGVAHLTEAADIQEAILKVPRGLSARTAMGMDLRQLKENEGEEEDE